MSRRPMRLEVVLLSFMILLTLASLAGQVWSWFQ